MNKLTQLEQDFVCQMLQDENYKELDRIQKIIDEGKLNG